jgi:hypothetical protein
MKSLSVPPPITKADRVRERELLRYYRPSEPQSKDASAALQASSPDTTLTAFAQLVAIRLDVKSVLIKYVENPLRHRKIADKVKCHHKRHAVHDFRGHENSEPSEYNRVGKERRCSVDWLWVHWQELGAVRGLEVRGPKEI